MPYKAYGKMDKEDIYSIIAYIRTLPEQKTEMPERKLDFPLNFIVNTMPTKAENKAIPKEANTVEYGGYLVNAAACGDCHTKTDKGSPVKGMEFAGGAAFSMPSGTVYSANITSDESSGIGKWTKEQFVSRFKLYADSSYRPAKVGSKDYQTVMPWMMYSKMKTSDLEAIYTYLQSLEPVKNKVVKFGVNQKAM
jgi:mono/diheme cytochrome c family protein